MDVTETIELEIRELIKTTDKAWQMKLDSGIYWLPKSQCRIINNKVYIPEWLCRSKEIDFLDVDRV